MGRIVKSSRSAVIHVIGKDQPSQLPPSFPQGCIPDGSIPTNPTNVVSDSIIGKASCTLSYAVRIQRPMSELHPQNPRPLVIWTNRNSRQPLARRDRCGTRCHGGHGAPIPIKPRPLVPSLASREGITCQIRMRSRVRG